jgi:putative holliday junction resolvase
MNTPSAPPKATAKSKPKPDYGPDANLQATPQVALSHQLFLAIDYGQKRTGIASGNRLTRSATPQGSIQASGEAQLVQVVQRIKTWQPDALVIGIPFHPDGVAHENTARARRFAQQLRERTRLTVYEVDERYSTTEALSLGASNADAASAAIILEQFLRSLP